MPRDYTDRSNHDRRDERKLAPPSRPIYLTVKGDRILAMYRGANGGEVTKVIDSVECLRDTARSLGGEVYCSSSLDFPEESTSNEATIALAHAIRS